MRIILLFLIFKVTSLVSPFIMNNFRLNSKMGVESIGMTKKKKRLCPKTKTNSKDPPSNHKQTQFITIASQYSQCIQRVFKFSHLIIIPKITNMLNFFYENKQCNHLSKKKTSMINNPHKFKNMLILLKKIN